MMHVSPLALRQTLPAGFPGKKALENTQIQFKIELSRSDSSILIAVSGDSRVTCGGSVILEGMTFSPAGSAVFAVLRFGQLALEHPGMLVAISAVLLAAGRSGFVKGGLRTPLALTLMVPAVFMATQAEAFDAAPGETISGNGTIVRSNVGATSETGESLGWTPGNTMWYQWTAPSSGTFIAGTCNQTGNPTTTTFDTAVRLYRQDATPVPPFTNLTQLSSNDDTTGCAVNPNANYGSTVTSAVTAGTTYLVQVDGYFDNTGTFLLHYGLAGITVNVTDGSATEGGDTAQFTVVLDTVPTGNVTVSFGTGNPQCTRSPTSRTFTPSNWSTPQTVTITATNDTLYEGTHSCTLASITATGGSYNGVSTTPPTITIIDNDPAVFTNTKVASTGTISAPGTITYTMSVANISGANLTGISFSDALTLDGVPVTLTSGPTYTSGDSNSNGVFNNGETWVYTATYAVTQADIDAGGTFSNVFTFDTTQSGPIDSNAATTTITQSPAFSVSKAQTSGPSPVTAAGQTLGYTITVQNTGNLTLTGLSLSDALLQAGSPRTLTSGPTYSAGDSDSDGNLDVGETWTYAATYLVTQTDMDNGGTFSNTATFDTAQTVASTSSAVTTAVTQSPAMTIGKVATFDLGSGVQTANGTSDNVPAGTLITYTYTVANTGNVTIANVTVSDAHNGSDPDPVPGNETPVSVANGSSDGGVNGSWDTLRPGDTIRFTATYTVTQTDVDQLQ